MDHPREMRARSLLFPLALLAGCDGPQSALEPAGEQAESLARIFWWMSGGALAIWLLVVVIAARAAFRPAHGDEAERLRKATRLIIYGGMVIPTVVLAGLLVYGLALLPRMLAPAPRGSLQVAVEGRQWWWRVRYLPPAGGEPIELANEIRLPKGEPVEFLLESHDVIHSFWIPALGGKIDMIPGRRTRLSLLPTKTGELRGACAEFCGASHAFMAFVVVIQEKEDFQRWLENQRAPARVPAAPIEHAGRSVFFANGCGACHSVRGTAADGVIAPDLTHVGGRASLAGWLPNQPADFERWVAESSRLKPGAHMPMFKMLSNADRGALAAFLESLK